MQLKDKRDRIVFPVFLDFGDCQIQLKVVQLLQPLCAARKVLAQAFNLADYTSGGAESLKRSKVKPPGRGETGGLMHFHACPRHTTPRLPCLARPGRAAPNPPKAIMISDHAFAYAHFANAGLVAKASYSLSVMKRS